MAIIVDAPRAASGPRIVVRAREGGGTILVRHAPAKRAHWPAACDAAAVDAALLDGIPVAAVEVSVDGDT